MVRLNTDPIRIRIRIRNPAKIVIKLSKIWVLGSKIRKNLFRIPDPDPQHWPELKGLCHEMNFFFKPNDNNRRVLSVHAVIVFTPLLLSWWKFKLKFSLLLRNYLLILKIILVTRFKDPKAAILILKMFTRSRFFKIVPKAARDKLNLAHFTCSKWEFGTGEHRQITARKFWGGFSKHFQN